MCPMVTAAALQQPSHGRGQVSINKRVNEASEVHGHNGVAFGHRKNKKNGISSTDGWTTRASCGVKSDREDTEHRISLINFLIFKSMNKKNIRAQNGGCQRWEVGRMGELFGVFIK